MFSRLSTVQYADLYNIPICEIYLHCKRQSELTVEELMLQAEQIPPDSTDMAATHFINITIYTYCLACLA